MICYRDKTYCTSEKCKNKGCSKRLTDKVWKDAESFGLPVCTSDLSRVCSGYWAYKEGVVIG